MKIKFPANQNQNQSFTQEISQQHSGHSLNILHKRTKIIKEEKNSFRFKSKHQRLGIENKSKSKSQNKITRKKNSAKTTNHVFMFFSCSRFHLVHSWFLFCYLEHKLFQQLRDSRRFIQFFLCKRKEAESKITTKIKTGDWVKENYWLMWKKCSEAENAIEILNAFRDVLGGRRWFSSLTSVELNNLMIWKLKRLSHKPDGNRSNSKPTDAQSLLYFLDFCHALHSAYRQLLFFACFTIFFLSFTDLSSIERAPLRTEVFWIIQWKSLENWIVRDSFENNGILTFYQKLQERRQNYYSFPVMILFWVLNFDFSVSNRTQKEEKENTCR